MQISQDLFNRSLNKLAHRQYKKDYTPAEEQIILSIQDKVIGCLSSFVIYSGIPKSSKSTFMAITCASAFTNFDIFGIKLNMPHERKRVVYFDTESSEFDFYKQINKIKYFANLQDLPETFSAFAMREDNPKEILTMVESFLITNTDTSVLILGVLHLGKKDMQTLGHFGSQSDRYAQSTLKIERNKEQNLFTLSSTFLRSSEDFTPINLTYNNGWYEVNASQNKPHTINDWSVLEHKRCALNVLGGSQDSYDNIVQYLKEMLGIGTNAAKGIVKKWIAEKIITKRDKNYILC